MAFCALSTVLVGSTLACVSLAFAAAASGVAGSPRPVGRRLFEEEEEVRVAPGAHVHGDDALTFDFG